MKVEVEAKVVVEVEVEQHSLNLLPYPCLAVVVFQQEDLEQIVPLLYEDEVEVPVVEELEELDVVPVEEEEVVVVVEEIGTGIEIETAKTIDLLHLRLINLPKAAA